MLAHNTFLLWSLYLDGTNVNRRPWSQWSFGPSVLVPMLTLHHGVYCPVAPLYVSANVNVKPYSLWSCDPLMLVPMFILGHGVYGPVVHVGANVNIMSWSL